MQFPDIHTDIDVLTQTVVVRGDEKKVRPKTFQLLQMLIEADGELVSKEMILKTVWDDVFVDEQVIFQSIKELRKRQRGFFSFISPQCCFLGWRNLD